MANENLAFVLCPLEGKLVLNYEMNVNAKKARISVHGLYSTEREAELRQEAVVCFHDWFARDLVKCVTEIFRFTAQILTRNRLKACRDSPLCRRRIFGDSAIMRLVGHYRGHHPRVNQDNYAELLLPDEQYKTCTEDVYKYLRVKGLLQFPPVNGTQSSTTPVT